MKLVVNKRNKSFQHINLKLLNYWNLKKKNRDWQHFQSAGQTTMDRNDPVEVRIEFVPKIFLRLMQNKP